MTAGQALRPTIMRAAFDAMDFHVYEPVPGVPNACLHCRVLRPHAVHGQVRVHVVAYHETVGPSGLIVKEMLFDVPLLWAPE